MLLVIRETKSKPKQIPLQKPTRTITAIIKKKKNRITIIDKDVEKSEHLYTAGWDVK